MVTREERMEQLRKVQNEMKNLMEHDNLSKEARIENLDEILSRFKFQVTKAIEEGVL